MLNELHIPFSSIHMSLFGRAHLRRDEDRFGGSSRCTFLLPPGMLGTKLLRPLLQRILDHQMRCEQGSGCKANRSRGKRGATEDCDCCHQERQHGDTRLCCRTYLELADVASSPVRHFSRDPRDSAAEQSVRVHPARVETEALSEGNKSAPLGASTTAGIRKQQHAPAEMHQAPTSRPNGACFLTLRGSSIEMHCEDEGPVSIATSR